MALIQEKTRLLAVKTALGPDVLAIRTLTVREEISRLFQIEVELSSEDGEIKFDDVVGHPATVRLDVAQKQKRFFHGFVSRLVQVANTGGYAHYRASIVPWLWFLTRTSDCRIFQEMTVPEIIEATFKKHDLGPYQLKLTGNYAKKEYCVQYRETDFNFVSRLMEQEGIYYFFEHKDDKHTLVLADSISAHHPSDGYAEVTFHELEKGATGREVITDWSVEREVQPVAYALTDYDFKKPKTSLLSSTRVSRQHGHAGLEVFDFPGEYVEHDDGDRLANVRLNELQSQLEVLHGQASARGLAAGGTFKLKNHPRTDQNREYLITGVSLHVDAGEFASNGEGGEFFSCSFTAIDKTQQFRPARLTPKPIVQGPQTAIVVGPGGDEIHTDKHARVKVHFHWDRHHDATDGASCWIRVSQFWAGKEWGSIHIPRIGQEVIVEFLEGDPDRPIITGRVYNAEQVPPYGLPANKTQSGVKSRSSKGGGGANFNEIRFEDKMGSEEVYIHAEKDQNNVVEHDETTKVGHDRTENVGHDEKITIGNNRAESVGNNEQISIGNNRTESVGSNENIAIGKNRTENVQKNEGISIGENRNTDVGKNEDVTIGENRTETVGKNENITIGENREVKIGKNEKLEVSGQREEDIKKDDKHQIGQKFALVAGEEILLKTGDASITMKKDGTIQIKGKDITVVGSGKIGIKASSDLTLKGSKIAEN
jgi:type VI secretion system secreted protein VgrG